MRSALTYMTLGKQALALREVEKITAENPHDKGVKLILAFLDKSPAKNVTQDLVGEDEEVESASPSNDLPDADWYEDPMKADELRFWNGTEWTEFVSNDGIVTEKAL